MKRRLGHAYLPMSFEIQFQVVFLTGERAVLCATVVWILVVSIMVELAGTLY